MSSLAAQAKNFPDIPDITFSEFADVLEQFELAFYSHSLAQFQERVKADQDDPALTCCQLVLCQAKKSQARLDPWPEMAFGLAWIFEKPKLVA